MYNQYKVFKLKSTTFFDVLFMVYEMAANVFDIYTVVWPGQQHPI